MNNMANRSVLIGCFTILASVPAALLYRNYGLALALTGIGYLITLLAVNHMENPYKDEFEDLTP